jgi:hypothetical protein
MWGFTLTWGTVVVILEAIALYIGWSTWQRRRPLKVKVDEVQMVSPRMLRLREGDTFSDEDCRRATVLVRKIKEGWIVRPITVRTTGEIISGKISWYAQRLLGAKEVAVIVKEE